MTMYLLVFKQGQSALSAILSAIGGMYEDNLYLSNLYEYLEHSPSPADRARDRRPRVRRTASASRRVSFAYPGRQRPRSAT